VSREANSHREGVLAADELGQEQPLPLNFERSNVLQEVLSGADGPLHRFIDVCR